MLHRMTRQQIRRILLMRRLNKQSIAPILLVLSVLMIAYGAWDGEAAIVLRKATRICLECIGVG